MQTFFSTRGGAIYINNRNWLLEICCDGKVLDRSRVNCVCEGISWRQYFRAGYTSS